MVMVLGMTSRYKGVVGLGVRDPWFAMPDHSFTLASGS